MRFFSLINIDFLSNLTQLNALYLQGNSIMDIKPLKKILDNPNIVLLDLGKNPISDFSEFDKYGFAYNSKLRELNLEKTEITDVDFLLKFRNLENLNIDANIPIFNLNKLVNLINLSELRISAKKFNPSSIYSSFKKLETLYLSFEEGDISWGFQLENLTELTIQSKKLNTLSHLVGLSKLEELNLSNCAISDISDISKLENLEILNLFNNEITDIEPITKLKKLNYLNLGNNKIKFIEPLLQLERSVKMNVNLEKLNLESGLKSNNISIINSDIAVRIDKNPLEDFPLSRIPTLQSLQDIRNYYADDIHKRTIQNREIKLILVGNSATGKTTLSNILRGGHFNKKENTTHGILVHRKKMDDIFVNFWDFGGQEYYHGTHRLFFSSNAIYVILWNNKSFFCSSFIGENARTLSSQ